jgi:guanidinopropionase
LNPATPHDCFAEASRPSGGGAFDVAVVGVPWDGGTRNPVGAHLGPAAIRAASRDLRRLDPAGFEAPYDMARIGDVGDVATDPDRPEQALDAIRDSFADLFGRGVRTVALGGDHLISLPIFRAYAARRGLRVVHIDAHSDTAEASSGGDRYSSATPFRRAIEERLLAPRDIIQVGLRGQLRSIDKLQWAQKQGVRMITMDEWETKGATACLRAIRDFCADAPVYVTFDIDAIDPVFAPGTGARVPGGLTARESLLLLRNLRGLDVVGCDLTEFAPPRDIDSLTAGLAAVLVYEMIMLAAIAARAARAAT